MTYTTIEEYNTYLVENQVNINIIDYVKEVNKLEFKIDISFIDEFIELVSKNECCIHHNMLEKYGILSLKSGTSDIKRLLEQNNFIENKDFNLRNVAEVRKNRGSVIKNEYYLHPKTFKMCLMRSLKTREYANYYLLLEECIKYFNDYQIELNKRYIIKLKSKIVEKDKQLIIKDDKIDELIKKTNEQNFKIDELLRYSKKSDKKSRRLEQKLDDTNNHLEDIKDELNDSNHKLNFACKKLDIAVEDRVPKTEDINKDESLSILKSTKNKIMFRYYAIRGQTKLVDRNVNKKIIEKKYEELLRIDNVANSVNLWNRLKELLKKDHKVEYCYNEMNLIKINEEEFKNHIKDVYERRREIIINNNDIESNDTD